MMVDFARRADPNDLPELMDGPCDETTFRGCVHDLGQVNRVTLGYRPTLSFLERVVAKRTSTAKRGVSEAPLRVLDVGFGGGDTLRRISQWGKQRGVAMHLMGIDLNPRAEVAAKALGNNPEDEIRWLTGDALTSSEAQGHDVVLSALMTHHMPDEQIVEYLRWSESNARCGWFVNDLLRSRVSYSLFRALSVAMRWHEFVQHDGPVSIRRGFRKDDWLRLITAADMSYEAVELERWLPGRLCVARLK